MIYKGTVERDPQSDQANYRHCFSTFKTGIGLYDRSCVVYLCRWNVIVTRD